LILLHFLRILNLPGRVVRAFFYAIMRSFSRQFFGSGRLSAGFGDPIQLKSGCRRAHVRRKGKYVNETFLRQWKASHNFAAA
jgi:hypothetical protein